MDKAEKKALVSDLNAAFKQSGSVVIAHYAGLTVADMQNLRKQMKAKGGTVKVAKNRLTKLALQGAGLADFSALLTGPTVLAYSQDPMAAPKVASDFAKGNDNFVLLGGAMGETLLDASGVKQLASLPSLDELRGKLIGLLQAPATKIAGVLQAPAGQLARVFSAYGAKA
ncbi:MAG: 50S ribosomal protein L10 [Pseudomonadota bacterium]